MAHALTNAAMIVRAACGDLTDIGRLTSFVKYKTEVVAHQSEVGQADRRVFGKCFPAMLTLVVNDLVEDLALIEIEATACILQESRVRSPTRLRPGRPRTDHHDNAAAWSGYSR